MTTMKKKYQVFVSSTYEDLREERQEIMNALLELDCIPAGMELFPAADEDQWSLIQGVIDECDYYVLVIGGRYGTTGPDGVGYTEKEYRYALEQEKPIIAFFHKDPESLPKKKTEQKEEGQKRFLEFRDFVQKKMCKYWETPKELGSVVSRSLIMLQRKHPGIGWVRGDLVPEQDVSSEILTLKKEIEQLQHELEEARTQAPPGTELLAQGEDSFEIHYTCSSQRVAQNYDLDFLFKEKPLSWSRSVTSSWNDIFWRISPLLIDEESDYYICRSLNSWIEELEIPRLTKIEKAKGLRFGSFEINDDDFQTIKVQLRALGLITQSIKNRIVKDTQTYWKLTPYGDSIMNQLRAIKKEKRK
jgi:hypothetical protein